MKYFQCGGKMLVKGLLDRPSSRSFGMVPFVAQTGKKSVLRVHGIANVRQKFLTNDALRNLVRDGHAYDVSACNARIAKSNISLAAGWLGKDFEAKADKINAPKPEIPDERFHLEKIGSFWIHPSKKIYARLSHWIEIAASRAIREKNTKLADLMRWTLPGRMETQAAVWYTRKTEAQREAELAWQVKLRRDNLRPIKPKYLREEFETVVQHYLFSPAK